MNQRLNRVARRLHSPQVKGLIKGLIKVRMLSRPRLRLSQQMHKLGVRCLRHKQCPSRQLKH